jgi:hypothetical protein
VLGVCQECGGLDAATDLQLVAGDELVADHSDHGGHHREAEVRRAAVLDELVITRHRRECCACPDDERNAETGQVLGPVVSVRVRRRRLLLRNPEAEPHDRRG